MMVGSERKQLRLWMALALSAAVCGCQRSAPAPVSSEPKPAVRFVEPVPQRRDADDTARFLAGMPGKPDSPFGGLEATDAWKEHRHLLDEAWTGAEGGLIPGLREFQRQELTNPPLADADVFYPFSGPDVLVPLLYFPRSSRYVMVALEPPGTLPTLKQIGKKPLPDFLGALRITMGSELGRSFFITREMDRQFRGQVTDGLIIPILQILVRTNHTVLGFRYITLNDAGKFVDRPAEWRPPGKHGNKGIEIEFRSDADRSVHRLCYFGVNLDDKHLIDNDGFKNYAATLKGSNTMFKATSYMTHRKDFSIIRETALTVSNAILQDDSGIPFNLFPPETWKVQLYGEYTKPYGSFHFYEEPDLRKAYSGAGVKPLPMRVGYGFGKAQSNLQLARRTGS